jgi:hypothetical protein
MLTRWHLWRARQTDLDFQTKRADWLDSQLARIEAELKLTQKSLESERKAKDKVLLRHADMMSQKAGLFGAFVKDADPKKPEEKPQVFTSYSETQIRAAAELLHEADPVWSVEEHMEAVRQDPDNHIFQ